MTMKRNAPSADLRRAPRQARAQATVESLYGAVARIVATEGADALTSNRIAEVAGVSIGSFYQYFPDRDALVRAMIDDGRARAMAGIREAMPAATARNEPLAEIVRGFVRLYLAAFGGTDPAIVPLQAFAWRMADDGGVVAGMRAAAEEIGLLLEALPQGDAPNPARLFVLTRAFTGVVRAAMLEGSPLAGSRLLEDELVRLCMDGITAGPR